MAFTALFDIDSTRMTYYSPFFLLSGLFVFVLGEAMLLIPGVSPRNRLAGFVLTASVLADALFHLSGETMHSQYQHVVNPPVVLALATFVVEIYARHRAFGMVAATQFVGVLLGMFRNGGPGMPFSPDYDPFKQPNASEEDFVKWHAVQHAFTFSLTFLQMFVQIMFGDFGKAKTD